MKYFGYDVQFWYEIEYLISDMNAYSTHLLQYLMSKLIEAHKRKLKVGEIYITPNTPILCQHSSDCERDSESAVENLEESSQAHSSNVGKKSPQDSGFPRTHSDQLIHNWRLLLTGMGMIDSDSDVVNDAENAMRKRAFIAGYGALIRILQQEKAVGKDLEMSDVELNDVETLKTDAVDLYEFRRISEAEENVLSNVDEKVIDSTCLYSGGLFTPNEGSDLRLFFRMRGFG